MDQDKSACPLCGTLCSTSKRVAHLKHCSQRLQLNPQQLIAAAQLQQKHEEERNALGLPPIKVTRQIKSETNNVPRVRATRKLKEPKSKGEADLQMAIALSASLKPSKESEILLNSLEEFKKGRKNKKCTREPPTLILVSDEQRQEKLVEKVAILLGNPAPQKIKEEEPITSQSSCDTRLWDLSSQSDGDTSNDCFYVQGLLEPFQGAKMGSKLWHHSQIAGRKSIGNFTCQDLCYSLETKFVHEETIVAEVPDAITIEEYDEAIDNFDFNASGGFCSIITHKEQELQHSPEIKDGSDDEIEAVDEQREKKEENSHVKDLLQLVGNPTFSDASILTIQGEIPIHKALIYARCPNLFMGNLDSKEIDLSTFSTACVLSFLQYLYAGFIPDIKDEFGLFQLAQRFKLPHLENLIHHENQEGTLIGDFQLSPVPVVNASCGDIYTNKCELKCEKPVEIGFPNFTSLKDKPLKNSDIISQKIFHSTYSSLMISPVKTPRKEQQNPLTPKILKGNNICREFVCTPGLENAVESPKLDLNNISYQFDDYFDHLNDSLIYKKKKVFDSVPNPINEESVNHTPKKDAEVIISCSPVCAKIKRNGQITPSKSRKLDSQSKLGNQIPLDDIAIIELSSDSEEFKNIARVNHTVKNEVRPLPSSPELFNDDSDEESFQFTDTRKVHNSLAKSNSTIHSNPLSSPRKSFPQMKSSDIYLADSDKEKNIHDKVLCNPNMSPPGNIYNEKELPVKLNISSQHNKHSFNRSTSLSCNKYYERKSPLKLHHSSQLGKILEMNPNTSPVSDKLNDRNSPLKVHMSSRHVKECNEAGKCYETNSSVKESNATAKGYTESDLYQKDTTVYDTSFLELDCNNLRLEKIGQTAFEDSFSCVTPETERKESPMKAFSPVRSPRSSPEIKSLAERLAMRYATQTCKVSHSLDLSPIKKPVVVRGSPSKLTRTSQEATSTYAYIGKEIGDLHKADSKISEPIVISPTSSSSSPPLEDLSQRLARKHTLNFSPIRNVSCKRSKLSFENLEDDVGRFDQNISAGSSIWAGFDDYAMDELPDVDQEPDTPKSPLKPESSGLSLSNKPFSEKIQKHNQGKLVTQSLQNETCLQSPSKTMSQTVKTNPKSKGEKFEQLNSVLKNIASFSKANPRSPQKTPNVPEKQKPKGRNIQKDKQKKGGLPLPPSEEPVTPLPDYKTMITPELRDALKRFGIKGMPRKKAVPLLNHIYSQTHPDTELVSSQSIKLKNQMSPVKGPNCLEFSSSSSCHSSSSKSSTDDDLEDCTTSEPIPVKLKYALKAFITSNEELHEKILFFEPISVPDFMIKLKEGGLKPTLPELYDFFDEQGITFTNPREGRKNKLKPKRKSLKKNGPRKEKKAS